MYCKYCGTQIPDGSKFCFSCGRNLVNGLTREENEKGPDIVFPVAGNVAYPTDLNKDFDYHPFKVSDTEREKSINVDMPKTVEDTQKGNEVINPDGSINKDAYYARQKSSSIENENIKRNGENGYYYMPNVSGNSVQNNSGSNSLAIVGFVCSFFFIIVGLVISLIALYRAKETNDGKGFAIAGIVISIVRIFASIFLILVMTILFGLVVVN